MGRTGPLTVACGPDGDYCRVRPVFRFSAEVDFLDIEACGEEVLSQCVHRPVVRGRNRVRERLAGGTVEESEKNAASRLHTAGKLAKNERQLSRHAMDQRIPRENAGNMTIRNSQRPERPHSKVWRGKTPSRLFNEEWNQIDALNVGAVVHEKRRPVARTAAGIDG